MLVREDAEPPEPLGPEAGARLVLITSGCNCGNKNRATAAGVATVAGTYRVMVNGRQVYETSSSSAADSVAERFDSAKILKPGETA